MKDKNGKEIELGSKIKDIQGTYIVKLGNFNKDDNSEIIAVGDNGIRKLLGPERAKLFEIVKDS